VLNRTIWDKANAYAWYPFMCDWCRLICPLFLQISHYLVNSIMNFLILCAPRVSIIAFLVLLFYIIDPDE
jgi:hypothetical protein